MTVKLTKPCMIRGVVHKRGELLSDSPYMERKLVSRGVASNQLIDSPESVQDHTIDKDQQDG